MKDHKLLIATFFIVPLYIYMMGSGYSASFNLAEWTEGARRAAVHAWLIFQTTSIIMLSET